MNEARVSPSSEPPSEEDSNGRNELVAETVAASTLNYLIDAAISRHAKN